MIQFDEDKQKKKLADLLRKEEEAFVERAAKARGVEYATLSGVPVNLEALRLFSEEEARAAKIVAFDMKGKKVLVGVPVTETKKTKEALLVLEKKGFFVAPLLVSESSLEEAYKSYKDLSYAVEAKAGSVEISNEQIEELLSLLKTTVDVGNRVTKILDEKKTYKISRVVEVFLAGALVTNASDIHIEPTKEGAVVRYRLDGVLHSVLDFDRDTYNLLVNRLKLLAGLKINVRHVPQDGRFSVSIKDDSIDVRVSSLPGSYGESVVMRILNPRSVVTSLDEIGMDPSLLSLLEKEVGRPNGMVLTTGPTGSGKTTTLYAFLRHVYAPEMKIITIENPVEYRLPGIVQSQTDAERGFTFLQGLRAAVRQDPDIIMVGEIRDEETARTAIDAALTGHLVFSTLHTNNAAGAYTRLIDLKVNPKIITSALAVSIAQRLARRLCEKCKVKKVPTAEEKKLLEGVLSTIKMAGYPTVVETLWTAPGCEKCNKTGFRGRIGIFEAILSNAKIEEVVINNPSEREIRKAAEDQGILTLQQDGVLKILRGVTSLEEINRVVNLREIF